MNILINGKEVFINVSAISSISDISTGESADQTMYEIKMINGDVFQLEQFSFLYFRNYSSTEWATFNKSLYMNLGGTEDSLSKNKFIKKA